MSRHSIQQYYTQLENIIHYGGTKKETAIRNAFYMLLNEYARQKGLILITEVTIKTKRGNNITPDGTLKDSLRQDWGYWESKDEADIIDDEIKKKFLKGYPDENILFEDSQTAVLVQSGSEVLRVSMKDPDALDQILRLFVNYERPEVLNFRKAIEHFKDDVPKVTDTLRGIIEAAANTNPKYVQRRNEFWEICKEAINPDISLEDIREMMIQHILTADIFNTIFDEPYFHRENNVAQELEKVLSTFFTGNTRKIALATIEHYYGTINAAAASIADHHEKQKFLKVVYETFYKSYNPKAADRLGVVYTPNEVVRFMVESSDYLLHKHFGKFLEDTGVDILDPATGTGTFICDIIDHIRRDKLEYKYKNELHANEVAILPYYIANLNVEFTYKQKMGAYAEFGNLCFVDTLDNMGFGFTGKQTSLFGVSAENVERIRRQNERKISVIIGNPPYNANQMNENENNKNREYPEIDKRIKDSFIKYSTAQKTKVYDMYARFYRWAFDRLDHDGIIAFITNRSFIDSRTFDGFRKSVQNDFDYAYIIDTRSDVRANPKIAGTTHNVFGIQTGVAIMFLVKKAKRDNAACQIKYYALDDFWRKEQKLEWLANNSFRDILFDVIRPDQKNNWINLANNDFETLLPLIKESGKSIFLMSSNAVVTNRDEWVYDFNEKNLEKKVVFFANVFNQENPEQFDETIKWSETLKRRKLGGKRLFFDKKLIVKMQFRPFISKFYYSGQELSDRLTQNHKQIFGEKFVIQNPTINLYNVNSSHQLSVLASDYLTDLGYLKMGNGGTYCLPKNCFDKSGKEQSNITDWGLQKFHEHYQDANIKKEDIFHYVYAVLYDPLFRRKYELNLKREYPFIPFYFNFWQWKEWGKTLLEMHIGYEKGTPYPLREITDDNIAQPKTKLKADKTNGQIVLDEATTLDGIPPEAWEYKLGNRSALEWILDQYKESKPKDPTIAEKFDTYRFADYKTQVIDLLKRVCTVSVETVKIMREMEAASESK